MVSKLQPYTNFMNTKNSNVTKMSMIVYTKQELRLQWKKTIKRPQL